MTWLDAHIDLAYLAVEGRDLTAPYASDDGCVSLPALRSAGVDIMLATIFTAPDDDSAAGYPRDDVGAAHAAGVRQLEVYERLESTGELTIVRSAADLGAAGPLPRAILLMEGADPIRTPEEAAWWFERGLRVVGLTWAAGTRYVGGNASGEGMSASGRELVAALDELGAVHDASHLSDRGFDALFACATGPIVATHSNCRALLAPSERHLRDDQIRAIVDRGGMIGLNLYERFLSPDARRATLDDAVRHVEHVVEIAGTRTKSGLGSDMDGGFGPSGLPVGLDDPARLGALTEALRGRGWSDEELAGFRRENWMREWRRWLPA